MHDLRTETATEIAKDLLEITGQALLAGDFDRFAGCFRLPQSITTMAGSSFLETLDDIRETFDSIIAHFDEVGLVRLERVVERALFDGPNTIRFSHRSHMHGQNGLIKPPYLSYSVIKNVDGRWLVTDQNYEVSDPDTHGAALLGSAKAYDGGRSDKSPPRAIFQHNLDEVTRAYMTNDFDLLYHYTQLPLFMQKSSGTQILSTREELQKDFDRYQTEFKVHGVTDIVRLVKTVELIGERRMHGTYRTHILRGNDILIPAYISAITLEQGDDQVWRITAIMQPMGHLTMDRVIKDGGGHV